MPNKENLLSPAKTAFIYVACADEPGIACYQLDYINHTISYTEFIESGHNIMPLAISPDKKFLYASIRSKPYQIESYAIENNTGKLTKQADSPLPASMPYIAIDKNGRYLLSASYNDNLIAINPIEQTGTISSQTKTHATDLYAHSIVIHPDNQFIYAATLGGDKIYQYHLSQQTGELTPMEQNYIIAPEGSGPRHIAIDNTGKYLYVLTEMHASILCYEIEATGNLSLIDINEEFPATHYGLVKSKPRDLVTPEEASTHIWAADIKITANGRFLYITERTSNTLSLYQREINSGKLTYLETIIIEKQPRSIAIDPTDKYLIATGQQDSHIGLYSICKDTGKVNRIAQAPTKKNANWVEIITFE